MRLSYQMHLHTLNPAILLNQIRNVSGKGAQMASKILKKIGREIPPLERREVKIRQRKSSLHLYYNKAKI